MFSPSTITGIFAPAARQRKLVSLLAAGLFVVSGHTAWAAITDSVTASGTSSMGAPVNAASNADVTVVPANPKLTLVKSATLVDQAGGVAGKGDPGETITYTYVVTNAGNVTLKNVGVTDAHDGTGTAPTPASPTLTDVAPIGDSTDGNAADNKWDTLKPGDAITFTASYVITTGDINADGGGATPDGSLHNTATASATYTNPQSGTTAATATDTKAIPLAISPGITLAKVATPNFGPNGKADPGETISYQFTVTNTGNQPLHNVLISDADTVTPAGGIATLNPGASNTMLMASHTLTAAEIATGSYTNNASVVGKTPANRDVTATAKVSTLLPPNADMSLAKSGVLALGSNGRADVGDLVTYTFHVVNTGTSDLSNVKITDTKLQLSMLPGQGRAASMLALANQPVDMMTTGSIAPVPTENLNAYYFHTPESFVAAPEVPAELNVTRRVVRMSGSTDALQAGDKIGFVYGLYNSGEAPLTSLRVVQADAFAFGDTLDLLAANTSDSASIIYTRDVTADEIATGTITAPAALTAKAHGHLVVASVADQFPVSGVRAYDNFASSAGSIAPWPVLHPGEAHDFTATYPLTQADIDAGKIDNTAVATAKDVANTAFSNQAIATVIVPQGDGVAVIKTGIADLGSDNVASVGDKVTYGFTIINTGNTTLTNVSVTDTELPGLVVSGSPIATLNPGESKNGIYSATYQLTQADLDAGKVSNQATVSAVTPLNGPVSKLSDNDKVTETDKTVVTLAPQPAIGLVKSIASVEDVNSNGLTDAGDIIHYAFLVKNNGNVTLNNITVTDPSLPLAVVSPAVPLNGLAPGTQNTTYFTATYKITQADVDKGEVDNTAHVVGYGPDNTKTEDDSDPGVPTQQNNGPTKQAIPQKPVITLVKKDVSIEHKNGNTDTQVGDIIHYSFTLANAGNVTLTNIYVTENLAGALVKGTAIATKAPGAGDDKTFTGSYTIQPSDLLNGQVSNSATAHGTPPNGLADATDLSDNSDPTKNAPTITPIVTRPALAVIKTATGIADTDNSGSISVGDVVSYTFKVKNTGNVPLSTVTLTEKLNGANVSGGPILTLNAGSEDSSTFTATYALTQADIDASKVSNQVEGKGLYNGLPTTALSDNNVYTEHDATLVTWASAPAIALLKVFDTIEDTNTDGITDAGDTIVYHLTVSNEGNKALSAITVTDANAALSGSIAALGVGATDATSITARHLITAQDIASHKVDNQASVTATVVGSVPVQTVSDLSDPADITKNAITTVSLNTAPGMALIKTVGSVTDTNGNGTTDEGDTINYAFTVINTGNVDLKNITLTDANAVVPTGLKIATLAPGKTDTATFTASHLITADDAYQGKVSNTAKITAAYLDGLSFKDIADVSDFADPAQNRPTVLPVLSLTPVLTKTAAKPEIKRGETDIFTITASNLGSGPFAISDMMPPGFAFVAGSATVNGVAAMPTQSGQNVTFNPVAPVAGKLIVKLKLLSSTTLSTGKFYNNAQIARSVDGKVLGKAQVAITIADEAVFDCSDIIGRVFDDLNSNGYMDDGEPGMPGVRLVTLNGILITTDVSGLYHVPCAAIPDAVIGSNYLLKLDVRTLPTGYKLTTENPRDVRVTRGKVTKLNFGAAIDHEVRIDTSAHAFAGDGTDLSAKWQKGIDRLIMLLGRKHSTLKIVYRRGGESEALAQARLDAVQQLIAQQWSDHGGDYSLAISAAVEEGK